MIQFTVPGHPVSKKRHKTAAWLMCNKCKQKTMQKFCRKCGGTDMYYLGMSSFEDKGTQIYENLVAQCAQQAMNGAALYSNPIQLSVAFYFDPPVSRKCVKEACQGCKKLHAGDAHIQRPDLDNCVKSILDGCNQVAWTDDCIITSIYARKEWGHPRAEVTVNELGKD